jgi:hypothetical protein
MKSPFTLGVRQEKEASIASLSLLHLSLWLKSKSPSLLRGFADACGVPTVELVQGNNGGLGCCPIWQPRENRLPQVEPLCKSEGVQGNNIGNSLGLVRGTPSPQKQRAASFKSGYRIKAPDEYGEKDNPGNEQLFDAATGAASRSLHGSHELTNLSRSIPDPLLPEYAVAPYCKCKGTRLLWKKISLLLFLPLVGCHTRLRFASPQIQRGPVVTCIVIVDGDKFNAKLAEAAINACRQAAERKGRL